MSEPRDIIERMEAAMVDPGLGRKNLLLWEGVKCIRRLRKTSADMASALHRLSLGAQDSGTTKQDLGREARAALEEVLKHERKSG